MAKLGLVRKHESPSETYKFDIRPNDSMQFGWIKGRSMGGDRVSVDYTQTDDSLNNFAVGRWKIGMAGRSRLFIIAQEDLFNDLMSLHDLGTARLEVNKNFYMNNNEFVDPEFAKLDKELNRKKLFIDGMIDYLEKCDSAFDNNVSADCFMLIKGTNDSDKDCDKINDMIDKNLVQMDDELSELTLNWIIKDKSDFIALTPWKSSDVQWIYSLNHEINGIIIQPHLELENSDDRKNTHDKDIEASEKILELSKQVEVLNKQLMLLTEELKSIKEQQSRDETLKRIRSRE